MTKYRAKPTTVDGIRFASKAEALRYRELRLLEQAKEISDLRLQVKFPLKVEGVLVCHYISDFCYKDTDGTWIVEDVKGVQTPVFRLKAKLFKIIYKKEITLYHGKRRKSYRYN